MTRWKTLWNRHPHVFVGLRDCSNPIAALVFFSAAINLCEGEECNIKALIVRERMTEKIVKVDR